MFVSVVLIISILTFCWVIQREEKRRKEKLKLYFKSKDESLSLSPTDEMTKSSLTHFNNENNDEIKCLKKQINDKNEMINKLQREKDETDHKVETYLSMSKTSQELVLKNEERMITMNKLWEDKAHNLENKNKSMENEIAHLKDRIEKDEDELNSRQYQINNLNIQLRQTQDRLEEVESQLDELDDVQEKLILKSQRMLQLENDLESLEETFKKENEKLRSIIREKDIQIEEFNNAFQMMKLENQKHELNYRMTNF